MRKLLSHWRIFLQVFEDAVEEAGEGEGEVEGEITLGHGLTEAQIAIGKRGLTKRSVTEDGLELKGVHSQFRLVNGLV